jgi:hypothetical protein
VLFYGCIVVTVNPRRVNAKSPAMGRAQRRRGAPANCAAAGLGRLMAMAGHCKFNSCLCIIYLG